MKKVLIVIDMQNDFIDGSLGTPEAVSIVENVKAKIRSYPPKAVIVTMDTHGPDYLSTREGRLLPVPHCIRGTAGWEIHPDLEALRRTPAIDNHTFGSTELVELLRQAGALRLFSFGERNGRHDFFAMIAGLGNFRW